MENLNRKINLQLFAEGDTTPEEVKEIKSEEVKPITSTVRSIFGLKDKEPDKKEPEEETVKVDEPEVKEEVKAEESVESEFDEILYNKERVKIPVSERSTYLQKGYNYDKVQAKADSATAALLRAAKLEGFDTTDAYIAELGNREKVKLSEQLEDAIGDPDKINEIVDQQIKTHPEVIKTKEERRLLEFEKVKNELRKDQFFKELEPEFDDLMARNPAAEANLVYSVLVGDYVRAGKFKELITKEKESVERKVLADVHDKERRAAPTGGDTNEGKDTVQPNEFSRKIASIFGVSASKIAQRSHEKLKGS